ncbi:MAG: flippase-like domain-containing protein [Elusimicrobiaceae bacterium]
MNKTKAVTFAAIVLSLTVLALVIHSGYDKFARIISEVKMLYLLGALFCSSLAYVFMGVSLWEVLRLLGYRIGLGSSISIAVVSTTINYVISTMGVSGFALRAHLLRKRNVPFGVCVTTSVVISVLIYIILAAIIMLGTMLLLIHSSGSKLEMVEGFTGVSVLLAICFGIGKAFLDHKFRAKWTRAIWHGINHILYFFSGPLIPKESFVYFETQLEAGINVIHKNKAQFTVALVYICADWIFTLLALYMGFLAVGIKMHIGQLVAGFALGMVTVLIPILPGGLGAMELTMSAVFSNMGVDWNAALVACLIFRLVYYFIPAIFSVFVYWGLKLSEPLDLKEETEAELSMSGRRM